MPTLFDPLQCGDLTLPNRVVMAPLTRMRAKQPGNVPWELNATYYAQRATAGLIVTEATQVCPEGQGYPATPGIHSTEQVQGWKLITQAVHERGGRIFLQLWHVGRISHRTLQPQNQLPVAPSAIKPKGGTYSPSWEAVEFETPRALETSEVSAVVEQYKRGAMNAKAAGFDGVEVHGANGYLIDQFLQDGTNQRRDQYGGSIENRVRFLLEVTDAVVSVWGNGRVGVRLSPFGSFNDMADSDSVGLFTHALRKLGERRIAYAHLVEPRQAAGESDKLISGAPEPTRMFRDVFQGVMISAGGYTREEAMRAVEEGRADAIAFGRLFISNPDLVQRLKSNSELNKYHRPTFYGGEEKGYTDYPALD